MNKQNIRELKTAWAILDGAKYTVTANDLHKIIEEQENKEPKELADLLFNDELAQAASDGTLSKDKTYTFNVEKEHHGEYTLTIYEGEDEIGQYQWYTDEEDAKEDVAALELQGFNIEEQ